MKRRKEKQLVLVLNKGWTPIITIEMRRAIKLVMRGHARIVEADTYEIFDWDSWIDNRAVPVEMVDDVNEKHFIRTSKLLIKSVDVVTLSSYSGIPKVGVPYSRQGVYKRDKFICQYCGKRVVTDDRTIDHVMPVSRGGQTTWTNCVLSHRNCNHKKADRTPEEAGLKLLKQPVKPSRDEVVLYEGRMRDCWKPFLPAMKEEMAHEEIAHE